MRREITKGSRVVARWMEVHPCSLAGMQPKVGATEREVRGVVTHVRGDHPTAPTAVRLWVRPDDGGDEVVVDPRHVVAVAET